MNNIFLNPLSPKSDQHQFSPNCINTQSREDVMRTGLMISKGEMVLIIMKFSQLIL